MTRYDWLMLLVGASILLESGWRWHRLSGTAAHLALARALFGLGFLLASTKLSALLGVPAWRTGFSVVGVAVVVAGLVLQSRAVGSSYRNIGIMLGSIVAMVAALALGIFLAGATGVDTTVGLVAIMLILLAAVGGATVKLLRNDPLLGSPVSAGVAMLVLCGFTAFLGAAAVLAGETVVGMMVIGLSLIGVGLGVGYYRRTRTAMLRS